MSIDWITVAAQLANFLLLVWLLKRFLYQPVLDGIDAREAEIAERMQVATRAKEEADAAEAEFQRQLKDIKTHQASAAEAVRQQAQTERDALLADARDRIEQERAAWQTHLDSEAQSFRRNLHKVGGHALLELTRKALKDLSDETLEARIAAYLGRRIAGMDSRLKQAAGAAQEARVTSHAELAAPVAEAITAELRQYFPAITVRFETDATQAAGLSLHLGGAHLAWTVDTYIDGLEALLADQVPGGSETRIDAQ